MTRSYPSGGAAVDCRDRVVFFLENYLELLHSRARVIEVDSNQVLRDVYLNPFYPVERRQRVLDRPLAMLARDIRYRQNGGCHWFSFPTACHAMPTLSL